MKVKVIRQNAKGEFYEEFIDVEEPVEPIIWHYQRPMRVQVPMQLVRENKEKIEFGAVDNESLSQLLTYMLATETIERKIENDTLYAYFDTIFEQHESILNSVGLTVENRPL